MLHNQSKADLRVRRTRKLLRDALVVLMEERGFEAITVNAIADKAMINRVTFYRHYRDKYDLLVHCMDDVFEEIRIDVEPPALQTNTDMTAPLSNLKMIFTHIKENATFYRVMLGASGASSFTARLNSYLREEMENRFRLLRHSDHQALADPGMCISFSAAACIGVIRWWLDNGLQQAPEEMASHTLTLIIKGPYRSLGFETK